MSFHRRVSIEEKVFSFSTSSNGVTSITKWNKRGRYVAVAEYREGRKRDAVMLPEGTSRGLAFAG